MRKISPIVFLVLFCCSISAAQNIPTAQPSGPPRYAPSSSLAPYPEPEDGRVAHGAFSNDYFQINYPVLAGWEENLAGSVPSANGYYVLGTLRTQGDVRSTVLVDAQDEFFAPLHVDSALEFAQWREHQAATMFREVIDRSAQEIQISGHHFARFDYNGAGYYHAVFSTILRCHVVTFDVASRFPEIFQQLDRNMQNISLLNIADPANGGGPVPVCVKGYASDATIIHKVDPVMVGPRYTKVPVRFVIDERGKVKHIHVINALPVQAQSVEAALAQWVFKPYIQNGHAVELESGILFNFPGDTRPPDSVAANR